MLKFTLNYVDLCNFDLTEKQVTDHIKRLQDENCSIVNDLAVGYDEKDTPQVIYLNGIKFLPEKATVSI